MKQETSAYEENRLVAIRANLLKTYKIEKKKTFF